MSVNVLVALDGSPLSERALTYAIETFPDAPITAIYIINPINSVIDVEAGSLPVAKDWYENAKEEATRVHMTATDLAAERNTELDTVTEVGKPAQAILDTLTTTTSTRSSWVATAAQESTGRSSEALPRQSPAEHESQ
jgi:hypothetical protein